MFFGIQVPKREDRGFRSTYTLVEGVQLVLDRLWFWTASLAQMCPTAELSTGHCRVPPQAVHRSVCCKDTGENVQ